MPDANAGVTPQTATAEPKTVTSAAVTTPASSSTSPNQDLGARAKAASSPAELRKLMQELRQNPLKQGTQPPKPAETPEAAPATTEAEAAPAEAQPSETSPESAEATSTPEAAPEGGESQPEGGEADAQTEQAQTPNEGEDSIEAPTAKRMRVQLPEEDKVGRLAMAYMQRNRDWTLEQAMDAARNKLGIKAQPEQAAQPDATQPAVPNLPATVNDVDAAIKAARAERAKAQTELRFEDASELTNKIEDLIIHRHGLERQADQQAIQARTTYDTKFAASEARAVELYPDAANENSALGKLMVEIEQSMLETGDPTFHSPDKPLIIAQMAAAELRVAPRRKGAPPAPAKAAAPVQPPAAKKGVIPSGSSRTTAPAANQPPAIVQQFKAIKSLQDLRAAYKAVGIK